MTRLSSLLRAARAAGIAVTAELLYGALAFVGVGMLLFGMAVVG